MLTIAAAAGTAAAAADTCGHLSPSPARTNTAREPAALTTPSYKQLLSTIKFVVV